MRRVYFLFYVFWLLLPQTANAALMVPSADVTVVIETIGGDASFDFQFYGSGLFSHAENFTLTTQNGSASRAIHIPFVDSTFYNLNQTLPAGWKMENVACTGGYSVSESNIRLFVAPFSATTCTVTSKKTATRNPVIFIPGIAGTEIYHNTDKLWVDFGRMLPSLDDNFLDKMDFDSNLQPVFNLDLGGVIKKLDPLAGFKKFDYTEGLIQEFEAEGYQENVDFFTFPYDWRFGTNETNVQLLKNKIDNILSQTGASKVDVVAHSAGGILLKKYVLANDDHHVGKAVMVGVPNLGAPKALKILLEGDNMGIPVLSAKEIKKIARNMPGVYQLTPSREYQNLAGPVYSIRTNKLFSSFEEQLSIAEMQSYLSGSKDLNVQGFLEANSLHTAVFDTDDLSAKGVEVYNIVGCKQPTLSRFIEHKTDNPFLRKIKSLELQYTAGDGTVPLFSAESISGDNPIYYAVSSDHGKMPSQEGIRHQIFGLLAGQNVLASGMTTNRNACQLNGKMVSIYSPLDISVIDDFGNVTKVSEGDVQTDIPGSNLEVLNDHKFLFLPDGEYQITLNGTGEGTFTLVTDEVVNDVVVKRQVFSDVPVSLGHTGSLNSASAILTMEGAIILPDYTLTGKELADVTPPTTEVSVIGQMGHIGHYRSDVSVSLSAVDDSSGINKIQYILNHEELNTYTAPLIFSEEGDYTINYFSVDKAGNSEPAKTLEFTIDNTPPEFTIQFDPVLGDLVFSGDGVVTDSDSVITLTDPAGNVTKLVLKEKERKKKQQAEILSLSYNRVPANINKNKLLFTWKNSGGQLKTLEQKLKSKEEFNVEAEYNGKRTKLSGRGLTGKINETLPGLVILKVHTEKGDLKWSY